jgi:hypothetical protein
VGDDDPRLRGHLLYGLSPEVQASIGGRLIQDQQFESREPPSGGFLFRQDTFLAKGCIYGTVLKGLSVYNAYRIASD